MKPSRFSRRSGLRPRSGTRDETLHLRREHALDVPRGEPRLPVRVHVEPVLEDGGSSLDEECTLRCARVAGGPEQREKEGGSRNARGPTHQ